MFKKIMLSISIILAFFSISRVNAEEYNMRALPKYNIPEGINSLLIYPTYTKQNVSLSDDDIPDVVIIFEYQFFEEEIYKEASNRLDKYITKMAEKHMIARTYSKKIFCKIKIGKEWVDEMREVRGFVYYRADKILEMAKKSKYKEREKIEETTISIIEPLFDSFISQCVKNKVS